jgi:hypothetical protein
LTAVRRKEATEIETIINQIEMKEIRKKFLSLLAVCLGATLGAFAQKGYNDMEQLTINENVSSIITASEPIRLVDISTDSIAGDKTQ